MGGIELKLSHQLVVSYVGVMVVAAVVGGVLTILLEKPHVDETVDTMTETMTESELDSLEVRMDLLLATSVALFVQFVGDLNYQFTYATEVFNNDLAVTSFYANYDARDYPTNPPPNVGTNGISIEYSSWYKHTNRSDLPYLNQSSVLDNSHGVIIKSNPSFAAGVYMGFEDGMMRNYPYQDVSNKYPSMTYTCAHNNSAALGYDPRCRGWYDAARLVRTDVIFTEPYNDASTGLVMITLARAVLIEPDNFLVGVVGADITLDSLEDTVLSATVMEHGYTYMCDAQKKLIVHPSLDYGADSLIYQVTEKEFDSSNIYEISLFEEFLDVHVIQGERGQQSFTKNGDKWYVSYGPVNGTSYFLLMVVPEYDVTASVDALESDASTSMTLLIVIVVLVVAFILIVGTYFAVTTSNKITQPVDVFNRILHDMAEQNEDDTGIELRMNHDYDDINNLQNKIHNLFLAVKFSTDSYFRGDYIQAVAILNEVEEMFKLINQKRALGVVYNNKGNILRRADGDSVGYAPALLCLKASVDNITEFIDKTEKELNTVDNSKDDLKVSELSEFLSLFQGILASRLANYGDCLREAGHHEEALEALTRSYDLNLTCDNLKGMVQSLGNKGLVFMDLLNFNEAEQCFTTALSMAENHFSVRNDEDTLALVQQAYLNMGMFYYKFAQQSLVGSLENPAPSIDVQDAESQRLLELALDKLYVPLVISDRIPMHVKRTCVITIREIYQKYHGDVGMVACDKLDDMFPDIVRSSCCLNINLLIDVSPSMSGPRITSCEQTLLNIVDRKMRNGDVLTVNIFATAYDHLIPTTKLTTANRANVIDTLRTLRYRTNKGRTAFYSALSRMANELATQNGTGKEQWIVALTDGEDNERKTTYQEARRICDELNVKIILISVGLDAPHVIRVFQYLVPSDKYYIKSTDDPVAITDALGKGFEMAASSGSVMMESF